MNRYSVITEKNPREIVLLRGSGCKWRRCRFCDYHLDFSKDINANFQLNARALAKVTGLYKTLEVINSGSFCDLDEGTVAEILKIVGKTGIETIHIECHWKDRFTLAGIRRRFAAYGIKTVVKMGVETFDSVFRDQVLLKGMEDANPQEIADYADEACLLFGLSGQTSSSMVTDIETGLQFFQRVCINLMTENSSGMKPDQQVLTAFCNEIYPLYKDNVRVDILLDNTGFGVGDE